MRFHVKTISKESDLNLLGATYPGYSLDDILDLPWHQQLHAKTNSTKDTWLVNRRDEYLKIKKREWQVEKPISGLILSFLEYIFLLGFVSHSNHHSNHNCARGRVFAGARRRAADVQWVV